MVAAMMGASAIHAQDDAATNDLSAVNAPSAEKIAEVTKNVQKFLGDFQINSISGTDVPGLYELVSGGSILYVNESGTRLFEGEMIDLENRVSLTEQRLGKLHMDLLVDLPADQMLTYEPENATGRSITVFTDISCGYCQRLHSEIDTLLESGVAVNYLLEGVW